MFCIQCCLGDYCIICSVIEKDTKNTEQVDVCTSIQTFSSHPAQQNKADS